MVVATHQLPKASTGVRRSIEAGWTPVANGLAAVTQWSVERRPGEKPYHGVDLVAGERRMQISISPNGRAVHIYVDGNPVAAPPNPNGDRTMKTQKTTKRPVKTANKPAAAVVPAATAKPTRAAKAAQTTTTAPKPKRRQKVEIFMDAAGEWRWRLVATNGRIVGDSGEGYKRKGNCVKAAQRNNPDARLVVDGVAVLTTA